MARMGSTYHVSVIGPVPLLIVRVSSTYTFGGSGLWAVPTLLVSVGSTYTDGES